MVSHSLTAVMGVYGTFIGSMGMQLKNKKDYMKLALRGGFCERDGETVVLHAKADASTTWGIPVDALKECTENLFLGCTNVSHWEAADLEVVATPCSAPFWAQFMESLAKKRNKRRRKLVQHEHAKLAANGSKRSWYVAATATVDPYTNALSSSSPSKPIPPTPIC